MQNIFIELLPPWIETGLQPAFYDKESGTVLQQVSRMWAKMIELGQGFNTFSTNVTDTVNSYITQFNELYTYVHDYFDNLDVQEEINNKLDQMVEDGTFQRLVGEYLVEKLDYFEITNQTEADVATILDSDRATVIVFKNDYTFTSAKSLGHNTTIDLGGHTLTFNVPSVIDDYHASHGFYNFVSTDVFLGYNGNSNITIKNGKIIGGNLSFCHAKNINIIGVDFENCKNNHILEMCAISGLTVDGCSFAGIPYGSTGEYIQNDTAIFASFTWFDENSTTYDSTPCRNITIRNSEFKPSSDQNYVFVAGIGTHVGSGEDTHTTKHINIENCTFTNPQAYAIQFYNVEGLNISDCIFSGTETSESSIHIRLRSGVVNTSIRGCSFYGMTRALEMAREHLDTKGVLVDGCTFEHYTNAFYPEYSIITVWNPIQVDIVNSTFRDFNQIAIDINRDENYDTTVKHIMRVNENLFAPQTNKTGFVIRVRAGFVFVENNTLDMQGYTYGTTSSDRFTLARPSADSLYYKNNTVPAYIVGSNDMYDKEYDSETGTGGFKHVYGRPCVLGWPSSASGSLNPTEYIVPFNFDTMVILIGPGNNTQRFELKDWNYNHKLTARSWKIPTSSTSGSLSVTTITIAENGTVSWSGTEQVREILFINKI